MLRRGWKPVPFKIQHTTSTTQQVQVSAFFQSNKNFRFIQHLYRSGQTAKFPTTTSGAEGRGPFSSRVVNEPGTPRCGKLHLPVMKGTSVIYTHNLT